jgi:hypothetical protein
MNTFAVENSYRLPIFTAFLLVILAYILTLAGWFRMTDLLPPEAPRIDAGRPVPPGNSDLPLVYRFRGKGVLFERDRSVASGNPYWWLDSGAKLIFSNGTGSTIMGPLSRFDRWRFEYAQSNALDTDGGYYPQNIFRLVSRQKRLDYRQTLYFQIKKYNLSSSDNRNESNGVLLFNRYEDGDNLYYAGLRVDGTAVIKKKQGGTYYTMAQTPVIGNSLPYDRQNNPNLLPLNSWLGIQSLVRNLPGERVLVELYLDREGNGLWEKVLSVIDDGRTVGPALSHAGYTGVRTDFMDVIFWQYRLTAV